MSWRCGDESLSPVPDPTYATRLLPSGEMEVRCGEQVWVVAVAHGERGEVFLGHGGQVWHFQPERGGRRAGAKKTGSLTAPMTGVVAKVLVQEGEEVPAYAPLAVVEAMKVMATIEAPFAGRVGAVLVRVGERVEHGQTLVELLTDP